MNNILVLQSDFGLVDGAVSAMEGVALGVSKDLIIKNLTHEIDPFQVFQASYRLYQTVEYWPEGTTFVSVVDPGVGSDRKSIVAKTKTGQYIVTPDNGTITHLAKNVGIEAVREISEVTNRRQNSEKSYTFHGRDVYAYTGARLAADIITFEEVGPEMKVEDLLLLPTFETVVTEDSVKGCVDILDVRFGSLWTSIHQDDFNKLNPKHGDKFEVTIKNHDQLIYGNDIVYGKSFADVKIGSPIIYINSVYRVAVAINQGSFARAYFVKTGNNWTIELKKIK